MENSRAPPKFKNKRTKRAKRAKRCKSPKTKAKYVPAFRATVMRKADKADKK